VKRKTIWDSGKELLFKRETGRGRKNTRSENTLRQSSLVADVELLRLDD
jgi:hypothetical protein